WRAADALWGLGRYAEAQRAYRKLVAANRQARRPPGDLALAQFRIAEAHARDKKQVQAARRAFRQLMIEHPAHPLAREAGRRLHELGGRADFTARERIARAERLTEQHRWHESIAELAAIGTDHDADTLRERDYWTGMTLFK